MPITLGTDKAWRVRRVNGGLVTSYQWLNGEPCLFVYPEHARRGGSMAVPLDCAHQWAGSDGTPNLEHAIPTAIQGAWAMGLDGTSKHTVRAIVDAVVDGLPDLVAMPPSPPAADEPKKPVLGEATITVDGETVSEREITAP